MPEDNGINAKAKQFFDKADEAAANYNFDYAIDLYLQGLRCNPDALQDGHLQLRELALMRQGKGGKKPSIMERMKYSRGKTPLEQLLNAEYLMARDPEHLPYIEAMLRAAVAGGYNQTAKWIADLLFAANNASQSPSAHSYLLLKDSYAAIGQWDRAVAACQYAAKLRPGDGDIADEAKRLSAELTVSRGKYDQAGDFRKSIKNREEQELFQSQQGVIKTKDYRVLAVEAARKAYEQNPESAHSIFGLAGVLADMRNDQAEEEAIKLLEDAYKRRQDFSFKERAGLIRIGQVKRKIREADEAIDANPEDSMAKSKHAGLIAQLNKVEMEHYGLCVKNYPTDLKAKYEYGLRLVYNKRYDEAIPMLQEAQKDLRHKIAAMSKIGLCFFMKGWYADAEDIFVRAIESYEIKDDDIAKELRYNLARSFEEQGKRAEALDIYRKIAQIDFGFKDVSQRVDRLRKEAK
ncbi:MAG: tetratricopeptide repeat protein [Sedimentisphaerales bacterium]|jgi:Tfp pilus assembly protein PilF